MVLKKVGYFFRLLRQAQVAKWLIYSGRNNQKEQFCTIDIHAIQRYYFAKTLYSSGEQLTYHRYVKPANNLCKCNSWS